MNTTNDNDGLKAVARAMQHSKELHSKVYERVLEEGNNLQEDKSDEVVPDSSEA